MGTASGPISGLVQREGELCPNQAQAPKGSLGTVGEYGSDIASRKISFEEITVSATHIVYVKLAACRRN